MRRFDYEKNSSRIGGPGGQKGQRVGRKNLRPQTCSVCGKYSCDDETKCARAKGQERHNSSKDARNTAPSSKPKSTKPQPKVSKSKFISNLRAKNPSISDSQIKKELKKAGYNTGLCGVVLLAILAGPAAGGYGIYELVSAVWG